MSDAVKVSVDASGLASQLATKRDRLRSALRGGLGEALTYAAGRVELGAAEKGLKGRTGQLLPSIAGRLDEGDALSGTVGVPNDSPAIRYAYLLTGATKHILPRNAKALTIPTGANLTGAGVARYPSAASLAAAFGADNVQIRGSALGVVAGERFTAYFRIAKEATVKGRDVLDPAIEASRGDMVELVQQRVDALIAESAEGGE